MIFPHCSSRSLDRNAQILVLYLYYFFSIHHDSTIVSGQLCATSINKKLVLACWVILYEGGICFAHFQGLSTFLPQLVHPPRIKSSCVSNQSCSCFHFSVAVTFRTVTFSTTHSTKYIQQALKKYGTAAKERSLVSELKLPSNDGNDQQQCLHYFHPRCYLPVESPNQV